MMRRDLSSLQKLSRMRRMCSSITFLETGGPTGLHIPSYDIEISAFSTGLVQEITSSRLIKHRLRK